MIANIQPPIYLLVGAPQQLVFILAALDELGVPPSSCVACLAVTGSNRELVKHTARVCRGVGIPTILPLPNDSILSRHWKTYARSRPPLGSLFIARGSPTTRYIVAWLRALNPANLVEVYDGFRTPVYLKMFGRVSAGPSQHNSIGRPRGRLRTLANPIRRDIATIPDRIALPAQPQISSAAEGLGFEQIIALPATSVKKCLLQIHSASSNKPPLLFEENTVVVLTNLYSQHFKSVDPTAELAMYRATAKAAVGIFPDHNLLIKPHPRTDPRFCEGLSEIAENFGGNLILNSERLIEASLLAQPRRGVVLVSPPSTALINAEWLGLAKPLLVARSTMAKFLGDCFAQNTWIMNDYALFESLEISQVEAHVA